MAFLCDEAVYGEVPLNQSSFDDFRRLVAGSGCLRGAELVLMDNGNLQAIWEDERRGKELCVQFLGNREVRYVIVERSGGGRPQASSGWSSLDRIVQRVEALGLGSLLCRSGAEGSISPTRLGTL